MATMSGDAAGAREPMTTQQISTAQKNIKTEWPRMNTDEHG
jgi:hypothetical protein